MTPTRSTGVSTPKAVTQKDLSAAPPEKYPGTIEYCDVYRSDVYRSVYRTIAAAAAYTAASSSTQLIFSDLGSSPWWGGRVVEYLKEDFHGGPRYTKAGGQLAEFAISHHGPLALSDPEVEIGTTGMHRLYGLDLGSGVMPVNVGAIETLTGLGGHDVNLASYGAVRSELFEEATALATNVTLGSVGTDEAIWDDSDDEPRWLAIQELPYHGGGVMARRRSRE